MTDNVKDINNDLSARKNEKELSLASLQNKIKKDPEAYRHEFEMQFKHFQSTLELFKLKPQKPAKEFAEQVSFLSHTTPYYQSTTTPVGTEYAECIMSLLQTHSVSVLNNKTRDVLVKALLLLRNRLQVTILRVLPVLFSLFKLEDKSLRLLIVKHIINDIININIKNKDINMHNQLKNFIFDNGVRNSDLSLSRRSIGILVELYRKRVWTDDNTVNKIASATLSPDQKMSATAANFVLGNISVIISEDSDEEKDRDAAVLHCAQVCVCVCVYVCVCIYIYFLLRHSVGIKRDATDTKN
eukprot:GHVR01094767.1.p1 GENE.GHVR01094767.1~~GHVR01094767.1.p1  ORF type:complete len:299 (+),score=73.93 GHVR01094767.1:286-1182(+)